MGVAYKTQNGKRQGRRRRHGERSKKPSCRNFGLQFHLLYSRNLVRLRLSAQTLATGRSNEDTAYHLNGLAVPADTKGVSMRKASLILMAAVLASLSLPS